MDMIAKVYAYPFAPSTDISLWKWNKNGLFSTKSVYEHLTKNDMGISYKNI